MKNKTYILFYTLVFLLHRPLFSQEFKILEKNNSFVILEFKLDTNLLKKIAYNKDSVDFRNNFYCTNRYKKPILPIFNYVFGLEDSSLSLSIQSFNTFQLPIKSIKEINFIKKRDVKSLIQQIEKVEAIRLNAPYENKSFIGQSLIIEPIQYDSIHSKLDCIYSITLKIQKSKRFVSTANLTTNFSNNDAYSKQNFYDFKKRNNKKTKDFHTFTQEMVILFQDSNKFNAELLANWKNQKGLKTNLINLNGISDPIKIKEVIENYYKLNPSLEYIVLLGNHTDIPAYYYGFIYGDNNFSDSYYGQISNDLYPEIYIGRITGSIQEINRTIKKSIFYEKENFDGDWMINSIGVASNEGADDGDNKEADWQHLRLIKTKLHTFGYKKVYEFYDNDHGGEDETGDPDKQKILQSLNDGVSLFNYTGHGDNNLMLSGQLTSYDLKNLTNNKKNPFIISVACNNGKFINNSGCIAETFLKCKDDTSYTGAIGFCGSTILMDWAPPMCTQDEIVNSITMLDSTKNQLSIGELFYTSQTKMLDKYGNLGENVMETWILFGDPSLDLKTKIPSALELSFDINLNTKNITIQSENSNTLLGISSNNKYVASYILKKGLNVISLDSINENYLLTFSKPNYITKQININKIQLNELSNKSNLLIYPNPISNKNQVVTIQSNTKVTSIEITDLFGKTIDFTEVENLSEIEYTLPNNLSSGIYLLKITDAKKQVKIQKLEIQ